MVLIGELYHSSSELNQVLIDQVLEVLTCQHCLFLEDAYVAPRVDDLCLDIPQGCVTDEVGIVVEETCRTDYFSVTCSLDVHHLG